MLDLRALHSHVRVDRRVGPDVRVGDSRTGADDRRAADDRALEPRTVLHDDASLDLRVDELALDLALDVLQYEAVRLQHVVELARVLPPAGDGAAGDGPAAVDQPLDRIRDLQLAATRRLDRLRGIEDHRPEHVHADEGEVAWRL